MITLPPFDQIGVTPTPPFVNASPQAGIAGSIVNGLIFNALQAELQNAIEGAGGLTPTNSDYTQILQSLSFGGLFIGTFGGAADALTATIPGEVVIPALKAGMRVTGFIANANATTSPTLAVAGFTTGSAAAPIKRRNGSAPAPGDLAASMLITFRFDGTNWRIDGMSISEAVSNVTSTLESNVKLTSFSGSGGGSISNNGFATMTIAGTDTAGNFTNNGASGIKCNTAGLYWIALSAEVITSVSAASTVGNALFIYVNGQQVGIEGLINYTPPSSGTYYEPPVAFAVVFLNVNDVITGVASVSAGAQYSAATWNSPSLNFTRIL